MATGAVVPEERDGEAEERGDGGGGVREGVHGRSAVPPEGGSENVSELQRAL